MRKSKLKRYLYRAFGMKNPYSYQTIISWITVDSRNIACHQLWAAYRWERE